MPKKPKEEPKEEPKLEKSKLTDEDIKRHEQTLEKLGYKKPEEKPGEGQGGSKG